MSKSNEEEHLRGESLPEGTQVFRVKVAKCFLSAGVPLSTIECFRELLEETGHHLTDRRHMLDYIPFIQEQEISQVKKEIEGANVAVIFDGSTHVSEALLLLSDLLTIVGISGKDWSDFNYLLKVFTEKKLQERL